MSQTILLSDSRDSGIILDKRIWTNIIASAIVIIGFLISEPWNKPLLSVGLFSLSGALTNWIAVYMLFERVPGIYGSGVVPLHFEHFKKGIHQLIMRQFFDQNNLEKFFKSMDGSKYFPDIKKVLDEIDFNPAFDSLLEVIQNSSFGPLLSIAGGKNALESLREPFKEKIHLVMQKITVSEKFQQVMHKKRSQFAVSQDLHQKIDLIITERMEELTPEMVKNIIESMIQKHLGWLVVWGGVFGGLIGLISSFFI